MVRISEEDLILYSRLIVIKVIGCVAMYIFVYIHTYTHIYMATGDGML